MTLFFIAFAPFALAIIHTAFGSSLNYCIYKNHAIKYCYFDLELVLLLFFYNMRDR